MTEKWTVSRSVTALAAMFFLLPVVTMAEERCPDPKVFKKQGGVLTAPLVDQPGEWLGMLPRDSRGPIESFVEAEVVVDSPAGGAPRNIFGKCTYRLQGAGHVDVMYRPKSGNTAVTLPAGTSAWKPESSMIGMAYFVCTASDPSACRFTGASAIK